MKRICLVACAMLALSGCFVTPMSGGQIEEAGPRPTMEQAQAAVAIFVQSAGFKDPDSVQVRDIVVSRPFKLYRGLVNGGGWNIGWEIDFQENAKNSFGGYVGYSPQRILLAPDGSVHWEFVMH